MSRSNYNFANYQSSSSGYQFSGGYQPKGGGYAPTTRGGGHGLKSSSSTDYLQASGEGYQGYRERRSSSGSNSDLSSDEVISNNTNEIIENNTNEMMESPSSESDTSGDQIQSNLLKYGFVTNSSGSQDYTQQNSGGGSSGYKLTNYGSTDYKPKRDYSPKFDIGKKKKKTGLQVQPVQVQEQPQQVEQQPQQVEQQPQIIPSRKQRLEKQRERERAQWHTDVKQRTKLPTIPLKREYHGEQTNQQSGQLGMVLNGKQITGTHYAHSGSEYNTDIIDGKLHRGGKTVDSTNNKVVYMKDHKGRSNYALDGAGGFYSSGVMEETDKYAGETHGKRHNHSSLVGGGDLTAAGTMVVKDGKVDLLGDDSGHYQPNMTQTFEAVKHLRDRDVMSGKSKVELVGKREGEETFTSSVDEFMRYEDVIHKSRQKSFETGVQHHLSRPEQLLRKELGARRKFDAQINSKGFGRKHSGEDVSSRRMRSIKKLEKGLPTRRNFDSELRSSAFSQKHSGDEVSQRRMRSVDMLEQGLQSKQTDQFKEMWAPINAEPQTLTEQDLHEPPTELPELQLDANELQEQPLEMLNLEPQQLDEIEQEVESEDADQGGVTDYLENNNINDYTEQNYGEANYFENPYAERYLERN